MTDDQSRLREALEFWRQERERMFLEIGAYRDDLVRVQKRAGTGWVDITKFQRDSQVTRLNRINGVIELLESVLLN